MAPLLLLKVTLLLGAALGGGRLLRRTAASSQHRFWSVAFTALLGLPLLALALPAVHVPVPSVWQTAAASGTPVEPAASAGETDRAAPVPAARSTSTTAESDPMSTSMPAPRHAPFDVRAVVTRGLVAAWIAGTFGCLAAMLLSIWRVLRLSRSATVVDDAAWTAAAAAISARLGLRRPPRLVAADVATPMAGGVWRPLVVLPRSARAWASERRDVVLAHEIAHVAGRDALRHVAARVAVALYWFHPLAWMAARRAAVAREQACDAAVLALGTRPSAYAQVLLDLADLGSSRAAPVAALPIVERSLLETRLMAILNSDAVHFPSRRLLAPAAILTAFTIALAAAQPSVRAAAAPGSVDAVVPGPARIVSAVTPPAAPAPAEPQRRESACALDRGSSFTGTMTIDGSNGRSMRQIGYRGGDRVIEDTIGDIRVCMVAEGAGERRPNEKPSVWAASAPHVIMEVGRGTRLQTLEIDRRGGGSRTLWRIDGNERQFDASAQRWRDRLVDTLDSTWEISTLLGEQSSLRGQISSIRGEESSLRGTISSLQGEVSSMRGRQSSVRGQESSLRGDISSIQGHVSSLRGEISSAQGAISSLNATRYDADAAERAQIANMIARRNSDIARIEQEIRAYDADAKIADVERQIRALDADRKVDAIETEIRNFDLEGKVAAVQREIRDLDVEGKVAAIERRITALDADRKANEIEKRRDEQLKQLGAAIDAIR